MKSRLLKTRMSGIRSFSDECKKIADCLDLTIGEPDLDTPMPIKEAAIAALHNNRTHYPPAIGYTELRQKIAHYESARTGETLTHDNILVTNGATEALVCAIWTAIDAGDEVIIPIPSFPLYQTQVDLAGGVVVPLDTTGDEFQITSEALAAAVSDKTKAIVIASPNNPTGIILNQQSIAVLYEHAKSHPEFMIITDDVYTAFVYEGDCPSIRQYRDIAEQIIVTQSFSKSYAMTGWRIGYVIASSDNINLMQRLHQNLVTGVSSFTQDAAMVALDVDTAAMLEDYRWRRNYIYQRLIDMGFEVIKPSGAFYIFPSVAQYGMDSLAFARRCAQEAKVAIVPGVYLGAEGYVRISYCYSRAMLKEGMDRLQGFVSSL